MLRVTVPESQNRENLKKVDFLFTEHIEGQYWYGPIATCSFVFSYTDTLQWA